MMQEILTIHVVIGNICEVKGNVGLARMICFSGKAEGSGFKGKVLPGGADTQRQTGAAPLQLSARYILEGQDSAGKKCRIFIENQGTADADGNVRQTTPSIITDSTALSWMETAKLTGTIEPWWKGVIIHIFKE